MGNLIMPEADFERFKLFCRYEGFDLCYFSSVITGTLQEIENYQFDKPKVIKLRKKLFVYQGIPYDVAEWQQEQWNRQLPDIAGKFNKMRKDQEGG